MAIARETWRTEGIRGFWRGSLASALGQAPTNFIIFGVYGTTVRWLDRVDVSASLGIAPSYGHILHVYLAGTAAGLSQSFALAPFDHLKVQQQLMRSPGEAHLSLTRTARAIVSAGGPLHIMRGTAATALRDGSSFGVYFSSYELSKTALARAYGAPEGSPTPELVMLTAGGFAGVLSWFIALPTDVVKSVIQGSPVGTSHALTTIAAVTRHLYATGGVAAFYRGLAPCLVRAVPVNAVTFFGYEYTLRFLQSAMLQ